MWALTMAASRRSSAPRSSPTLPFSVFPGLPASTARLEERVLPAAGEWWERHGLELLVLCRRQAVFDGLFKLFFTFVGAPLRDVTVDDKFGGKSAGLADSGWDRRETLRVSSHTFPSSQGLRLDLTEASQMCADGDARGAGWAPLMRLDVCWRAGALSGLLGTVGTPDECVSGSHMPRRLAAGFGYLVTMVPSERYPSESSLTAEEWPPPDVHVQIPGTWER